MLKHKLVQLVTGGLEKHFIGLVVLKENGVLGSGTLVRVGNNKAILTAAHVIDKFPENGQLGLIVDDQAHSTTIPISRDYFQMRTLGRSALPGYGPDLAYLLLSESALCQIPDSKCFYDLQECATDLLNNPLSIDASNTTWVLVGCPAELNIEAGPESGYAAVLEFCAIKGVGVVEDEHTQGEYDYLKFVVERGPNYGGPDSFGGCSGGALWQVQIRKDKSGQIVRQRKIFSGVPFLQSEWVGRKREITCHGRQGIYRKVIDDLSGGAVGMFQE